MRKPIGDQRRGNKVNDDRTTQGDRRVANNAYLHIQWFCPEQDMQCTYIGAHTNSSRWPIFIPSSFFSRSSKNTSEPIAVSSGQNRGWRNRGNNNEAFRTITSEQGCCTALSLPADRVRYRNTAIADRAWNKAEAPAIRTGEKCFSVTLPVVAWSSI